MKLLPILCVLAACSLSARAALPAEQALPPGRDALSRAVEQSAASLPAGGYVLAELQDGQVTFRSAGRPAPRDGLPPEKILFEIGSITKVFTSLLLAEAVNEGRARLTDPIAKHLPADLALDPRTAAITLEQLATHTSGLAALPANFAPADPLDPYADYTVGQLYDFLRAYRPAAAAPQPARYSNVGVGLLGHVLERIYGQSYAELVAARITGPLGLADTVIVLRPDQQSRLATPHSGGTAVKPWRLTALAGAGALRSTAADLARFAQALLSADKTPLTAAWALARQPRGAFGPRDQIGLSIFITARQGETVYHHSGGTGGFRSYLELTPATGRATVLWLNNDTVEPAAVVDSVRRPPPPPLPAAARQEQPVTAAQLAEYVGVYALSPRARFTFLLDEKGHLQARLTGQPFLPAFYGGQDRFFLRVVPAEYQFHRGASGRVDRVTLHQNGQQVPATRTAQPVPTVHFLTPAQAQAFVGRYALQPGINFEVTARGAQVRVQLTGQPAFPVFSDRPDHFAYDVVAAALTFERNGQGAITALVLHQHGANQRAPRIAGAP